MHLYRFIYLTHTYFSNLYAFCMHSECILYVWEGNGEVERFVGVLTNC